MKNKYCKRSHVSEKVFRQVVKCFAVDLTATQTAQMTGLNRNTINRFYNGFRHTIVMYCNEQAKLQGIVEVDESLFGAKRVKGKRGRGAFGKTLVFGIYERGGMVFTQVVPDASKATLQAIIRGKVDVGSVINSDGWTGYNGLVDVGFGHFRVDHSKDEFVNGRNHVNGIEGFWGWAKVRLVRFRGLSKHTFNLHLKECEFRFNNRGSNLYPLMLNLLRSFPLI